MSDFFSTLLELIRSPKNSNLIYHHTKRPFELYGHILLSSSWYDNICIRYNVCICLPLNILINLYEGCILLCRFQLAVVLASVCAVMLYRALMLGAFYRLSKNINVGNQKGSTYASLMVSITATTINLFCIVVLNKVRDSFILIFQ